MRVSSLVDSTRIRKRTTRWYKSVRRLFAPPAVTVPIFVFGRQRSGTTMLMVLFELHPQTEVFDEARESEVYVDYSVRNMEVVQHVVRRSRAEFACFKPLCDSHLARDFIDHFPNSRCIWMYRSYRDVVNSTLRKFEDPNVNVRKVCEDRSGGEGFRRELSPESLAVLKSVYRPELTEADVACLAWWARNRIVLEQRLADDSNVLLVNYEWLVGSGHDAVRSIFEFTGLEYVEASVRHLHARSIRLNRWSGADAAVERMCEELLEELDAAAARQRSTARLDRS